MTFQATYDPNLAKHWRQRYLITLRYTYIVHSSNRHEIESFLSETQITIQLRTSALVLNKELLLHINVSSLCSICILYYAANLIDGLFHSVQSGICGRDSIGFNTFWLEVNEKEKQKSWLHGCLLLLWWKLVFVEKPELGFLVSLTEWGRCGESEGGVERKEAGLKERALHADYAEFQGTCNYWAETKLFSISPFSSRLSPRRDGRAFHSSYAPPHPHPHNQADPNQIIPNPDTTYITASVPASVPSG